MLPFLFAFSLADFFSRSFRVSYRLIIPSLIIARKRTNH
jgi:hypothetical protein